jgi:uncharacterized repeat protein (TIGR03803 family)
MANFRTCVFTVTLACSVVRGGHASSLETIYRFHKAYGENPQAGLINLKGTLYGTTYRGGRDKGGTVFGIDPATGAESVVCSFDGGHPAAPLLTLKGILWGTTSLGGTANDGTLFEVGPANGTEVVRHNFTGPPDGATPEAGLIEVGKKLYGTTASGGMAGDGTVFKIDPVTGAYSVVYSFIGRPDGANPMAGLTVLDGMLYGTTSSGGAVNAGTVFKINPVSGAESVLHSFAGNPDGAVPVAGLMGLKGTLYGTTMRGGATNFGDGTIFEINPANGAESVIYTFQGGADGLYPEAALINLQGTLYGTTYQGGGANSGTVFQIDPSSGVENVDYAFTGGRDGGFPTSALMNLKGTLYGTTPFGGVGQGTVFRFQP